MNVRARIHPRNKRPQSVSAPDGTVVEALTRNTHASIDMAPDGTCVVLVSRDGEELLKFVCGAEVRA